MSEQVENVQPVAESIVEDVSPTDAGAMSFDELDQLTDGRDEGQLLNDNKKAEESAKKDEPEIEASSEREESETSEEEAKEEIKKLIAKYGEEELEIAANAMFKHKVDGEEVDVELQELLNNYSGKISYDKKFQELSSNRKEFESYKNDYDTQIDQINGYINNFAQKMKENDAMGALEYFASFAGMKPHEFRRELLNQMSPQIDRMRSMSPDQLRAEELEMQNAYLQQQQESAQQRLNQEQAIKDLENEIANVQEAHSISDEDFKQSYEDLLEYEYEGEITPAVVADYYLNSQAFSKAESILESISPALADEDHIVETFQKVIVENPSFDDNDLIEIVQDVYGDFLKETSKSVSKKAEPKKQASKAKSEQKQNFVDFDDL